MKKIFADFHFETSSENSIKDTGTTKYSTGNKDIAVIGISLKLPSAESVEEFWRICADGVNLIKEIPVSRRNDIEKYLHFKGEDREVVEYMEGAFLDEIDKFDYKFFKLSPKEACLTNPCQRMFLEKALEAIENAGYGGDQLVGSRTGVFVGYIADLEGYKYRQMVYDAEGGFNPMAVPGNLSSIIPSRISYLLDLKGPSMLIDTACSSSLVAVHLACESLRSGKCDMAIAGGIKVCILPVKTDEVIGIESAEGQTRAFDDSADGTGIGEGIGIVILKPLKDALRDRDNIYAVIKGSAINQDGSSAGITAPNASAQADLIIDSWMDADIDPETIGYIEAHGTGTRLGDPIEIEGIKKAFGRYTHKKQFCAIGSVKTNLGHLYEAAGIIGMIKAILTLKHAQIPPSLHFRRPNKEICFEESPVYLNNRLLDWYDGSFYKRSGVSSFGFSGTNCHVILEEAPKKDMYSQEHADTYNILTISAKTRSALSTLIQRYRQFLQQDADWTISDLCFTANTGRGHYNYRLAIIVKDAQDLCEKLNQLTQTDDYYNVPEGIFYNECSTAPNPMNQIATTPELLRRAHDNLVTILDYQQTSESHIIYQACAEICRLYARGNKIHWEMFYMGKARNRVAIPTYPFDKHRCWVDLPQVPKVSARAKHIVTEVLPISKLAEVVLTGRTDGEEYSIIEQKMGQIWGEVLGFKEINVHESFYELGGDSISLAKIANRLRSELHTNIELRTLFEYDSLAKIAKVIGANTVSVSGSNDFAPGSDKTTNIQKIPEKVYYPASSAQKRMYLSSQINKESTAYNVTGAVDVIGDLDLVKLEYAFNSLISRHEALRTTFVLKDGMLMQRILDPGAFVLKIKQIAVLDEDDLDIHIGCFIQPFDLSNVPLLRVALLKLADSRKIMLLDIHHIISDASSLGIVTKELGEIYAGKELEPLKLQYKDFVAWQESNKESAQYKAHETYWLQEFSGKLPLLNLPTDYERPEIRDFRGGSVSFKLDRQATSSVRKLAMETECTVYMVLLASIKVLLSKCSTQEDIVVGSPVAGRSHQDLENVVGVMINTIAIKSAVKSEASFREYLKQVREKALRAYEHQDYQFDELVEKLDLERIPGRNPLFDVMFVLQSNPKIEMENISFHDYALPGRTEMFDLSFVATYENEEIVFRLTYAKSLFSLLSINKLVNRYLKIIEAVANNSNILIKDINFITDEEMSIYTQLTDFKDAIEAEFCF